MPPLLPALLLAAVAAPPKFEPEHAARMAKGLDLFARHVRPVLVENCLKCHGGEKTRSGFDMVSRESLLKGGDHGATVLPGQSQASRLYKMVAHLEKPAMPPQAARLPEDAIRHLAEWIDLGAPYDTPLVDKRSAVKKPLVVTEEDRRFWAFQPLHRPALPPVKGKFWCRTPIDQFVLARLEEKGLAGQEMAERRRLIRRVYFDVVGLPPTPEEVEAFTAGRDPLAYSKLIGQLLSSPHFGERWARHWLDLARFAESHGFEQDYDRPTAYHYRDFVIRAFNENLPYDRFVQWQLAGDELAPENPEALAATGFLGAGVHSTQITANQVEKERYDELDDIVRTIGTSMVGMTIGCARCHDHKYDPIPTRDYYRLLSTFTTTVRTEVPVDAAAAREAQTRFEAEQTRLAEAVQHYEAGPLKSRLASWLAAQRNANKTVSAPGNKNAVPDNIQQILKALTEKPPAPEQHAVLLKWFREQDAEWRRLTKAVEDHKKAGAQFPKMMVCSEGLPAIRLHTQGADFFNETYFLKRGDLNQKDGVAAQSFLQVLMRSPDREKRWQKPAPAGSRLSFRRRALAAWITDVDQGAGALLARVIVNRIWQHYLGRGLVNTPSDFGSQGERPTHPELLDWLARELVDSGWDLRHIHRLILLSATYRQSSRPTVANASGSDRSNATIADASGSYGRRTPRRLEAEIIRDNMLAVGAILDTRLFGPGTLDLNQRRRSIYFFVKRSRLVPAMILFDAPDSLLAIEQRQTTTIAPQALLLMNNQLVRSCAESFARRLGAEAPLDAVVRRGYAIALGRPPGSRELTESTAFVSEQESSYRAGGKDNARHLALTDFCQVLLELNEFIYVD